MEYVKVQSSNLREVAWQNQCLHVVFHRGDEYVYSSVPYEVYASLLLAESVGSFFAKEIKNKYPFEKMTTPRSA